MKRIVYNYLKPQHYYNRLITFFVFIGLSLTLFFVDLVKFKFEIFLLKFIVILFLLMSISVFIELFNRGEYMSPLEIYDIELFYNQLMTTTYKDKSKAIKYLNKYDHKSQKKFKKIFEKPQKYFLSTIKKHKGVYEITFINEKKMLEYLFLKFFIRKAIHKIIIKEINGEYKVIRLF